MGKCGVILIGDCGVRSISVTTRDGVLLKATVKVRGGASVPQQSHAGQKGSE